MLKKLLAITFIASLVFSLTACGKSEEEKAEESKKALMGERP